MRVEPLTAIVCPLDGESMVLRDRAFRCARGHSFDVAKEGYVNLLPVQEKASKDPGDSREMVAARRRFLDTGAFASIADAVAAEVVQRVADRGAGRRPSSAVRAPSLLLDGEKGSAPYAILDAGCGEGYYLQALVQALSADGRDGAAALAGIDISKWAVRAAAKRGLAVPWVVASNKRLPFAAASIDLVMCLFGFPVWAGFAAVQPLGGHVLMVDPGPEHLIELRRIIYAEVKEVGVKPIAGSAGYVPISERRVVASAHLPSQAAIADLLVMTPHDHRASVAGRAALAERTQLDVTIDVFVRVFRRDAT